MPWFPIGEFGPVMKGLIIGLLGIIHVYLAQFAIGSGMLLLYFETRGRDRDDRLYRTFVDGFFKYLVLVSFVLGAVTGVGMWLTAIQVSPRTIGAMVSEFQWIWATAWTFFCLAIVAGYAFYRVAARLDDRGRRTLLVMYVAASWGGLFWINGILSWQLTPGDWPATRSMWDGFFNPGFWPSLGFRTISAAATAALAACIAINLMPTLSTEDRRTLVNRSAHLLAPMALMPIFGIWYFATMPEDSRSWVLGGSPAMTLFLALAGGSSALIGGYAVFGLLRRKLYINGATATLLCLLAFGATAGAEFVREGVRKPYTVRGFMYSNGLTQEQAEQARREGAVKDDPYPLRDAKDYPNAQLRRGAKVYRRLCASCHTWDGANGIDHLASGWSVEQRRINFAKLQMTKPFMPSFAGDAADVEALVQLSAWRRAGRPTTWGVSEDAGVMAEISADLNEAGVLPIFRGAAK